MALTKGELVEDKAEIAPECGKKPGVFKGNVAPWDETKNKLCKPQVEVINCNTSPTMTVYGLKPEVDVKINVMIVMGSIVIHTSVRHGGR